MNKEHHWLEYGKPTSYGRVWAVRRVEHSAPVDEARTDGLTLGTSLMYGVELIKNSDYISSDGKIIMTAVDDALRNKLGSEFLELDLNDPADGIANSTTAEALDAWPLNQLLVNYL